MHTSNDTSVQFYDALWRRTNRMDQHHKCRIRGIEKMIERLPATGSARLRILEPGCGSGLVSEVLSRYGEVTGIDQSPVGVETARRHVRGRFSVGVLPDLETRESEFDLCVLSQVLEHCEITDQVKLLENVHEKVRRGGHVIVTTPNKNVATRVRLRPGEREPIENWLSPEELRELLDRAGWEVRVTRFLFSFFPILASRYRLVRALRYLSYDVLRLRNVVEDLASPYGFGDCTIVLAVKR